jgi:ABC-type molybdate transport system substrate-binding protein
MTRSKKKARPQRPPPATARTATAGITVAVDLSLKSRFEQLALDYKAKHGRRVTLETLYVIALERGIPSYEELEAMLEDDE